MNKHTPGPWEIKWLRDPGINARGKHIEILHPLVNESGEHDSKIGGYHTVIGNKNCEKGYILDEANARLIAAAPEMYKALQAIRARIKGEFDHPALMEFGMLRPDITADILAIIEKLNI